MSAPNLRPLVEKLNPTCRKALENAAANCLSRTHYHVEIEHWLLQLLDHDQCDLLVVLKHYDVDVSRVSRELNDTLETMRTGNGRAPDIAVDVLDWMRDAWNLASLEYGDSTLRSGYLTVALFSDPQRAMRMAASSPTLAKIPAERLREEIVALVGISCESDGEADSGHASSAQAQGAASTTALDQFTINVTEAARKGEIDPVVGRDPEIRLVIDILTRRRQNNPILAGEAGVGKTAVVEGFALRVARDDVPNGLKNVVIRSLDLGLLQAGAGIKGEFENRLKSVISEVKASPVPIILFIDEAHNLMGAGGSPGQGDAANLLKPALARGELRTIAATTWTEYKKSFETDPALKRRFQVVKVEEPTTDVAVQMLRGLVPALQRHHKVQILEEAISDAVQLSFRYIPDRQLPDKAVSLLDTACARVSLSQSSTPAAVEDAGRAIDQLDAEIHALEHEAVTGVEHVERLAELNEQRRTAEVGLNDLQSRWKKESRLVHRIRDLKKQLEAASCNAPSSPESGELAATESEPQASDDGAVSVAVAQEVETATNPEQLRTELETVIAELAELQSDQPLIHPTVDRQAIAEVVAAWTGIPVGKMVLDEIQSVLTLQDQLKHRVVGQDHALEAIAQRIRTSRAGLSDPSRPIGVFLLAGPSGVGKTETAMALADTLYGGQRNMVVVNMSEYKEEHKISRLTGSAAGYVGYGEGGVLTEAVRRKPYSVVLLDEVEKAHPSVQEVFYQVFDKGMLQDDKGQEIDFRNTIILLTTNAASAAVMQLCSNPQERPGAAELADAVHGDLLQTFKPALLGRMTVVPYYPLADEVLHQIVAMKFDRIVDRVAENHNAKFTYDDSVVDAVADRCKEVETGARNADHIITGTVLPEISKRVLAKLADGEAIESIDVSCDAEREFVYSVN
jgi:type VI secretion system protein VasG